MRREYSILIVIVFLLSIFSGCTLLKRSKFDLIRYTIEDNNGYTSIIMEINVTGNIMLKMFDPSNSIIEEKKLTSGKRDITINITNYHETARGGYYKIKTYDENFDLLSKRMIYIYPMMLDIKEINGTWWKEGKNRYSLIEISLNIENKGNAPVYIEKTNISVDNKTYKAYLLNQTALPGKILNTAASLYIYDIHKGKHNVTVNILDSNNNVICSSTSTIFTSYNIGLEKFHEEWRYKWKTYSITFPLPEHLYEFCSSQKRPPIEDYSFYVIFPYDDNFVSMIANHLLSMYNSKKTEDIINFVASFVQNIEYKNETGEYPKFPIELLHDGYGDCEDKAIFADALLKDLGYDVALFRFSDHMAAGVHLDTVDYSKNIYYKDEDGKKYLFLETSGVGWTLGKSDMEYVNNQNITVYPVVSKPILIENCNPPVRFGGIEGYITIDDTIDNIGTEDAKDVRIGVYFLNEYGIEIDSKISNSVYVKAGEKTKINFNVDSPTTSYSKVYVKILYNERTYGEEEFVFL